MSPWPKIGYGGRAVSLRGVTYRKWRGEKSPPETPMLVEMGKSGTPALLLCELLRSALVQRLDLLLPMHARAGQIMLARKKRKEKKIRCQQNRRPSA